MREIQVGDTVSAARILGCELGCMSGGVTVTKIMSSPYIVAGVVTNIATITYTDGKQYDICDVRLPDGREVRELIQNVCLVEDEP